MEIFGAIGAVVLALAGYSAGNALGAHAKRVAPGLGDFLTAALLVALAFAARAELGPWSAFGAGVAAALAAGTVVGALRPGLPDPRAALGYDVAAEERLPGAWGVWLRFGARMGNFQGRLMMGIFYFLILTPFALLSRMGAGAHPARREAGSFWLPRDAIPTNLARARAQF